MAEFSFLATWVDSKKILDGLIALSRYSFIVRKDFHSSSSPLTFAEINEEIESQLNKEIHPLLLYSKENLTPKLYYMPIKSTNTLMIRPEYSDPAIEICLPHGASREAKILLYPGWLSYPSQFFNPETHESLSAPDYIKLEFRFVQRLLQKQLEKRYLPAQKRKKSGDLIPYYMACWIGRDALEKIIDGVAFIPFGKRELGIKEIYTRQELSTA